MTNKIVGGNVAPVIDLVLRFSEQPLERGKRSNIVILELKHKDQKMDIGNTVDEVNEVLGISSTEMNQRLRSVQKIAPTLSVAWVR